MLMDHDENCLTSGMESSGKMKAIYIDNIGFSCLH